MERLFTRQLLLIIFVVAVSMAARADKFVCDGIEYRVNNQTIKIANI